jgi:two-component sensor histidine kinase
MRARTRDVDAFADAIDSRLQAMAHVHRMLADTHFRPVDLGSLAASLLSAGTRMSTCPGACTVGGPPMTVPPRQTLPLSMILLEWFTNSCKYGACSVAGGTVDVTWEVVRGAPGSPETVRLRWREAGGPPVSQDVTPSLGTELVESFATLEMRGRCRLSYPEGGADHVLEFPRA